MSDHRQYVHIHVWIYMCIGIYVNTFTNECFACMILACMHVRVLCGSYHSLCPYTYMYAHETTTKLSLWVSGFNPNKATHAYTHTHTHTRTHTYTPYRWTALLSRLLSIVVLKWQSCHFLAQRSSLLMRLCACWGFVCDLNVCAPQYICTCIIGRLLATIHDDDNHFFYDF